MNLDELKADFIKQLNDAIDGYDRQDPKCAFASGMLLVLSALKAKDGHTIPTQIAVMHVALREVGEARGWAVARQ